MRHVIVWGIVAALLAVMPPHVAPRTFQAFALMVAAVYAVIAALQPVRRAIRRNPAVRKAKRIAAAAKAVQRAI